MKNKTTIDLGYCISQAIKDYGVSIDPHLSLLLANPLWMGLNTSDSKGYLPIERGYVSFIHPLALEQFSVNANCLFIPVRGNSAQQYDMVLQRLKNKKNVLVKLSDAVLFEEEGSSDVLKPIYSILDNVAPEETDQGEITLRFSQDQTRRISKKEFLSYWKEKESQRINAEWFVMIPSKTKMTDELLQNKLASAFVKQARNLEPSYDKLHTGHAVIEFLKQSLNHPNAEYYDPASHYKLWRDSMERGNCLCSCRTQYAKALLEIQPMWNTSLSHLIDMLYLSAADWSRFYRRLTPNPTERELHCWYKLLLESEKSLLNAFNNLVD
ncbi:MAG: hypothetical protein ABJM06_10185 [Gilvibacter sp.]